MELKALALMVALALVRVAAGDDALHGCQKVCGGVPILYPFGVGNSSTTGKNCFLDESFELNCNKSTLSLGNIPITNINLQGQMDALFFVSRVCYNSSLGNNRTKADSPWTTHTAFTISSTENKFISVGCDTYGYLNSYYNGEFYSTGCLTRCYNNSKHIVDGNCSGIGCCEVDTPPGMKNITIRSYSFENFNRCLSFNNCSYSFVVKNGNYTFSKNHLENLPNKMFPMVLDWSIGNEKSNDCKNNSHRVNSNTGDGYRCSCNHGYEGNPYHPHGCVDIDECKNSSLHICISEHHCHNIDGTYKCFCPKGQSGNGTKEGGCHRENIIIKVGIGAGVGFMALFVGLSCLYLIHQKRKLVKLKENFFRQNGGVILQQQLSERENSSQHTQVFTEEQLKKATNNFEEKLIIGRGGYGTVFKGFLAHNQTIAVKKSKVVGKSQIEQFINEVVVLSQINHRNVVKLLGCCLETEVPLLVYEFVNNGTLFGFLHNKRNATIVSWKTRLRIAAEVAEALSYLHSAASIPIIHRDVKSANILLDDTYAAKVSDFGASRLVPIDQTELATMVQGTIGYLDPEYMQTSQLTEKSDVYSFGVVLVELLTGEKPFSFERQEEERSLASHFLSCLEKDRLFDVLEIGILNEENKEEINEVALLAKQCLRLKGEERPRMQEVALELEGIRQKKKHPWINTDINLEETQYLLHDTSRIFKKGNSSAHHDTGYDSLGDHELTIFDDGR